MFCSDGLVLKRMGDSPIMADGCGKEENSYGDTIFAKSSKEGMLRGRVEKVAAGLLRGNA